MSVDTHTFLELKEWLLQSLGDYIKVATTTNITTNTSVVSTTLNSYDDGRDDYFNDWYVYINGTTNVGVSRKISDYATSTGTITVFGANLAAETGSKDVYVTRYNPDHIKWALIDACKEIYPTLHLPIDDQSLIVGNILPDTFQDWSSASALTWYSALSGTLARTTTGGLFRFGAYSAKYTAGADNDYIYIDSDSYPRLLDLQGRTIDVYVLAYPEVANNAYIVVYTVANNGTTIQTLTSTTTNAAATYTWLKLEGQAISDDLDYIAIRFKVATNTKYVYFDSPYVGGRDIKEYLLPPNLRDGHVSRVRMQTTSYKDPALCDLNPFATMDTGEVIKHDLMDIGNWRYIRLLDSITNERRLRVTGYKPLETLSADTDTITLDIQRVPLLIEYAKMLFLERESKPVSAEDIARFDREMARAYGRYQSLYYKHRMGRE